MSETGKGGLTREALKYIALATMTANHAAMILMIGGTAGRIMIYAGYFSAMVFCWLLTEGYEKTSSPDGYGKRLILFAVLSQLPFSFAFSGGKVLELRELNMIYSLLMCYLMIRFWNETQDPLWRIVLTAAAGTASLAGDWAPYLALFTALFLWAGKDRRKLACSFTAGIAVFFTAAYIKNIILQDNALTAALASLGESAGLIAAAIVILFFYHGEKGRHYAFSKWFCYIYYPVHLLILGLLR